MGLSIGIFQQLLQEHRARPFTGTVLTLGRQDVFFDGTEAEYWMNYYGMPYVPPTSRESEYSNKPDLAARKFLSDRAVFRRLGVAIESLDASPFEGCDHVADLNSPEPPAALRARFDAVLDLGTLEHVFNLPHALRFCHALLKIGGRMIHMSPLSNYPDHGYYSLSPTLYHDFYGANGWRLLAIKVLRHGKAHENEPFWATDYSPRHFAPLSFGGLSGDMYVTLAIAQKSLEATADRTPQQRLYREVWDAPPDQPPGGEVAEAAIRERLRQRLHGYATWIRKLEQDANARSAIAIYGGGRHTEVLLKGWREAGLPEPSWIVQSEPTAKAEFCGIRLVAVRDLRNVNESPRLIVLSSHTYEEEMAACCAKVFPDVPILRLWG